LQAIIELWSKYPQLQIFLQKIDEDIMLIKKNNVNAKWVVDSYLLKM
jgi:hypothetical protein